MEGSPHELTGSALPLSRPTRSLPSVAVQSRHSHFEQRGLAGVSLTRATTGSRKVRSIRLQRRWPARDIHLFAANPDDHLIQVPSSVRLGASGPQPAGDRRAKGVHPAPDALVRDHDAPLGQEFLQCPSRPWTWAGGAVASTAVKVSRMR